MQILLGSTPTISVALTSTGSGTLGPYYLYVNGGSAFSGFGSVALAVGSPQPVAAVTFAAADTADLGDLLVVITDSLGVVLGTRSIQIVAYDPDNATTLGLSDFALILTRITAVASAVWNAALPGAFAAGSAGYILGHITAPPDPWAVPLPGAYAAGEAGYILGGLADLLDADAVDTGLDVIQALKLIVAATAGECSISGMDVTYTDTTATIDRIVATTDGAGQRTSITYDLS